MNRGMLSKALLDTGKMYYGSVLMEERDKRRSDLSIKEKNLDREYQATRTAEEREWRDAQMTKKDGLARANLIFAEGLRTDANDEKINTSFVGEDGAPLTNQSVREQAQHSAGDFEGPIKGSGMISVKDRNRKLDQENTLELKRLGIKAAKELKKMEAEDKYTVDSDGKLLFDNKPMTKNQEMSHRIKISGIVSTTMDSFSEESEKQKSINAANRLLLKMPGTTRADLYETGTADSKTAADALYKQKVKPKNKGMIGPKSSADRTKRASATRIRARLRSGEITREEAVKLIKDI